ncbi:PWI domain-containing protein [Laetiporus sulphureus 93-53]|uniref:PWI domain-containing protein n=1 Tax=Laetiporus sulphureus 93-53 TaxID=1314785 RepID=A0A165BHN1_9APHY|nr:PWI domain-containing protein [Laetiporus sulphureus 93-53]KZT01073.1 PWI domain-containing protein [Laetiporus sulphureus 93-53]
MTDAGFFKGTSADQDRRFSDKELKLLKSMKFPTDFEKKVDMRKVNLTVIRPWVVKKIIELVGFEDEVVVEYAMGLLEDDSQPTPDPRRMQINLTGFLTNHTPTFMSALWKLLVEAQESPAGVPRTFVEEKKEEMRQAKMGDTRARGGRPRDNGWGGRGGRPPRRRTPSRSPPPRSPPPRSPPPRRRRSSSRTPPYSTRSSRSRSNSPPPHRLRSPRARSPSRTPPSRALDRDTPSLRRRSPPTRSLSRSPPPRRRARSPSITPPPRDRDRDRRLRDRGSRSPPPRRRRLTPPSRSRSPPYRSGLRRGGGGNAREI